MNEHRDRDKRKQHLVTKKIRRNETTNVLITVQHATPSNNWRRMDEVNMFCFETKTTHVQFFWLFRHSYYHWSKLLKFFHDLYRTEVRLSNILFCCSVPQFFVFFRRRTR